VVVVAAPRSLLAGGFSDDQRRYLERLGGPPDAAGATMPIGNG